MDATEFCTLNGNFELGDPRVNGGFQLWELPKRMARLGEECPEWRLGVRLGTSASGERPQRISDLPPTPPGIRKAAFREVMDALRYEGQVGYPPREAADAQWVFGSWPASRK